MDSGAENGAEALAHGVDDRVVTAIDLFVGRLGASLRPLAERRRPLELAPELRIEPGSLQERGELRADRRVRTLSGTIGDLVVKVPTRLGDFRCVGDSEPSPEPAQG